MSELTKSGREVFDQTPVSYPIKFDRPIPLHIRLQNQILSTLAEMRKQDEVDTPEDADDFDMDDDPDMWSSPYEGDFDHISETLTSGRNADILPHDETEAQQPSDPPSDDSSSKA